MTHNLTEWAGDLEKFRAEWGKLWGQLLTESHFVFCATCGLSVCSLIEAGDSGLTAGCSCILFALLSFSTFTMWGWSIKFLFGKTY